MGDLAAHPRRPPGPRHHDRHGRARSALDRPIRGDSRHRRTRVARATASGATSADHVAGAFRAGHRNPQRHRRPHDAHLRAAGVRRRDARLRHRLSGGHTLRWRRHGQPDVDVRARTSCPVRDCPVRPAPVRLGRAMGPAVRPCERLRARRPRARARVLHPQLPGHLRRRAGRRSRGHAEPGAPQPVGLGHDRVRAGGARADVRAHGDPCVWRWASWSMPPPRVGAPPRALWRSR